MLLHITGSNKMTRKLVDNAAWYFAEKLLGKRLLKTLEIDIKLVRNMTEKEGCEGTCIWNEWDDLKKTPREFTIDLDSSISIRNILVNLAHEFVHVKQWVKGEMYEYSAPNMVRFLKTKYDMTDMDYFDYPWEIEAFGRQLGLFVRWCEANGFGDREDMKEIA